MTDSDISGIVLATEYVNDGDVSEIENIFSSKFSIKKETVQRWEAGELLGPTLWIIFYWVGREIVSGFLNSVGNDIWNQLKQKISKQVSEKKYPGVRFSIEYKNQKITLDLRTDDPKLIEKGMDSMQSALDLVEKQEERAELYFDTKTAEWVKISKKNIVKTIEGICAAANVPIEKGSKTMMLRTEDLPEIAEKQVGLPISIEHKGRPVGVVTKAWVDGDVVRFEGGIFEGLSNEEEKALETMKGVSMEFHHSGFTKYEPGKSEENG